jgi:4-hydroxybenzoate polyprenyltransferase
MSSPTSVFFKIWDKTNILSLDVVAGALAGGIMASVTLDSSPAWAYWVVLPIAVWLIYTTDHLIDGYRAGKKARQSRRIFHRDNIKILSTAIVILTITSGYIAFTALPKEIIRFGIILGAFAIIYLVLVLLMGKKTVRWLPKEILVAAFYTAGIWVPLMLISEEINNEAISIAFLFFLLALEDLLFLSKMEAEGDRSEGFSSLAMVFGNRRTAMLINMLSLASSVLAALLILSTESTTYIQAGIILLLMQFGLSLISYNSQRLRANKRYRYLSEAVFFLPVLMLI